MKRSKPTDSSRRDAKSAKIEATPSTGYLESLVSSNLQSSVLLSTRDKSSHLSLSKCQMTCIGCKGGYRMIRATHGVHSGYYYYEALILNRNEEEKLNIDSPSPHFRVGWASRQAELEGPVGYDKFSFAFRDVGGAKVHASLREDDYGESYSEGDVIGCFIRLDETNSQNNEIRFFKNGKAQGVAYQGSMIETGIYFPAVSIYMAGAITVNFGPTFIYKPDISAFNGVSEVQPMSPADRKVHESRIVAIKQAISRGVGLTLASVTYM